MVEVRKCNYCDNTFKSKDIERDYCNKCKDKFNKCPVCEGNKRIKYRTCSPSCGTKLRLSKGGYNPFTNPEVQKRIQEGNMKKYGYRYPMESNKIQDKVKESNLKKHGVEYPFESKDIQEKVKKTNLINMGVEYPTQSPIIQEKIKQVCLKKYGYESPAGDPKVKEKVIQTMQERYGMDHYCLIAQKELGGSNSKPNKKFSKDLEKNDIEYEREFYLKGKSFDFKVGNNLIEINPTPTHNINWHPLRDPHGKDYHINKTLIAEENGYRCIHVFDWENNNKVITLLKYKDNIRASKCEIREVNYKESLKFLKDYHIQGKVNKILYNIGLYYNNELIGLMSFGKPRYNKNYEWELLRLCFSKNVYGGSQRLFKYFISNKNPINCISYCDKSKFTGNVYSNLGFTLTNKGKPMCHWYNIKTKQHITDNLLRQLGADKLIGTSEGKGTSNEEILLREGFVQVYDCGQDTYTIEIENKHKRINRSG